jgi:hypothetical protein
VLLVHHLLADAELVGDLLPAPAELPSALDLKLLDRFEERAKRGNGTEADGRSSFELCATMPAALVVALPPLVRRV